MHDVAALGGELLSGGKRQARIESSEHAMLDHFLSVTPLLGSKRKIDALPAPLQAILKEEAKAIGQFWRSLFRRCVLTTSASEI